MVSQRSLRVASIVLALSLAGCGYNNLQALDEQVKAAWAEVLNQYQRRADLIPNLVNTVKGYAQQEKDVLTSVTNARSRVGTAPATPDVIDDPEKFRQFQEAQAQMTGALGRLLAVVEAYPDLKSDANFRDLQSQLEGTENRIAVARKRFIETVQAHNTAVRSFPANLTAMMFGIKQRPTFEVENEKELAKPPAVDFGTAPTR